MIGSPTLAIEVRGLSKSYRTAPGFRQLLRPPFRGQRVEALRELSFEVAPGEVFGILGPNGAGKTTLVKILSTLVLPSAGDASVFGYDVTRAAQEVIASVGLVLSDERSFYWRLTVRENLEFFATLNDVEPADRDALVDALLETVGITHLSGRPFGGLSAGMRQRVALARAMLDDPPLLLMDEPTHSLDPYATRAFHSWLREELVEERGKTILLVTHDSAEAEALCDRIGILRGGHMALVGTPSELRAQHAGPDSYRLITTGWNDELRAALAGAGFEPRTVERLSEGRTELALEAHGADVGRALRVLLEGGVTIHHCAGETPPFSEVIAGLLDPGGSEP